MKLYNETSFSMSKLLTLRYSTSFSMSSFLFSKQTAKHVYAIYGLVRIADEIVDSYKGNNKKQLLNNLENEVIVALRRHYSTNPIVQSYIVTARTFSFDPRLLKAFFNSMRTDITKKTYDQKEYDQYIYGSAEVIGLMCLAVFTGGNKKQYNQLSNGARRLGASYQKVNFLRDIASDHQELDRLYFPEYTFETFNEDAKREIIADITADFNAARNDIDELPRDSRRAVTLSIVYYEQLIHLLKSNDVNYIKTHRIRVTNIHKIWLFTLVFIGLKR